MVNPVLPFFTFQSDFFSHIPTTILLVICLYFGVILLFAVIKSLRGG